MLVGEVLGWSLDAHWMADWSALSALARTLLRPPEWSDEVTLDTLAAARMSGYPAADS